MSLPPEVKELVKEGVERYRRDTKLFGFKFFNPSSPVEPLFFGSSCIDFESANDIDVLRLIGTRAFKRIEEEYRNTYYEDSPFVSIRTGCFCHGKEINIILTDDKELFEASKIAQTICEAAHVTHKPSRVRIFEAIRNGTSINLTDVTGEAEEVETIMLKESLSIPSWASRIIGTTPFPPKYVRSEGI